jgi:hypothetical protein
MSLAWHLYFRVYECRHTCVAVGCNSRVCLYSLVKTCTIAYNLKTECSFEVIRSLSSLSYNEVYVVLPTKILSKQVLVGWCRLKAKERQILTGVLQKYVSGPTQ